MRTLTPPPDRTTHGELRALREPIRLVLALPRLMRRTEVEARTVITVPGFGVDDRAMAPVRAYLRRAGHVAVGWERGRNNGEVEEMWPKLLERVREVADGAGDTVDLVGWSLGGVLAREAARDLPHLVGHVVTFGTPVVGGPRYTRAARAYGEPRLTEIEHLIDERERLPIKVPITALYSKRDGVVAWQACIDSFGNPVEHIEVRSTHLGMILDPDVFTAIGEAIGRERPSQGTEPAT